MMYDYLIVGAGLFGATFARYMTDRGKRCLVIDKRDHIAGNCYSVNKAEIEVHVYGPHIFHTNSPKIWGFVNQFATFNNYRHRVVANHEGSIYSLPINLHTFRERYGYTTPAQARQHVRNDIQVKDTDADSVESWCHLNIGLDLYHTFVKGYTEKHWGRSARDLPSAYIRRLPLRFVYNSDYFSDKYQGIPIEGYTRMVEKMLEGIQVSLSVDFFSARSSLENLATKVVYSGPIDALFDFDLGMLEYRAIRTEFETLFVPDFQGIAQVNYTAKDIPWTRIVEYRHFASPHVHDDLLYTIIGREYPEEYDGLNEPSYPIGSKRNEDRAERYKQRAKAAGYIVGGRLGNYQYLDMHQAIGQALMMAEREYEGN